LRRVASGLMMENVSSVAMFVLIPVFVLILVVC
jgi:hypothetical protein